MAFEETGLSLVPRGVEGTGAATILDNNQTVQSLARLSGRMDNLYRLKLLAGAKKEKAVKETPESKTPIEITAPSAGILGNLHKQVVSNDLNKNVRDWQKLGEVEKQKRIAQSKFTQQLGNGVIGKLNTDIPLVEKDLATKGWVTNPILLQNAENEYVKQSEAQAAELAAKNRITDKDEIERLSHQIAFSNDFPSFYVSKIKSDPKNINLNTFGDNVFKDIGTKGITGIASDGSSVEINSSNLFPTDINGNQVLDKNLAITAISSNEEDKNIFASAAYSPNNLLLAAGQTGDASAPTVTQKYIKAGNRTDNPNNKTEFAFTADEIKLLNDKILPEAEDNVLARMFAGRNNLKIAQNKQTTRQAALQKQTGADEAGTFTGERTLVIKPSINSVKIGPKGATEVLGLDGKPVRITRQPINFGMAKTRTLKENDNYNFAVGSEIYFLDGVPEKIKSLFASKNSDGSYSLLQDFKTNSLTIIPNDVYATDKETAITTKSGSKGFAPKGMIVNKNDVGAKPIGKNFAYVTIGDYLNKFYNEKDRDKLLEKAKEYKGIRILISTDENPDVITKFERETGDVKVGQSNQTKSYLGQ